MTDEWRARAISFASVASGMNLEGSNPVSKSRAAAAHFAII
jgi:hypothetical protein